MIYVTRREVFSASHIINNAELSLDENLKYFGKCNSMHGHNYTLEVVVRGEINPSTGYVIDLKILKEIIKKEITDKLDHKYLNEVDFLKGIITTTENLTVNIFNRLKNALPSGELYSVKIYETENNYAEYKGE